MRKASEGSFSTSVGRLRNIIRTPHFWLVGPILGTITIVHYFYFIGPLLGLENPPPSLLGESTERILYLLSMSYAGFVFGVVGGVVTLVAAVLIMLPHAFLISPVPRDAFYEIGSIALVGMFLLVWFGVHYRERRRAEQALRDLGIAQEKLSEQIQAIRDSERRSRVLNLVSEVVNRSLEVEEVRESALEKVMEVMEAEVAWVYVLDLETQELVCQAHRGLSEVTLKNVGRVRRGEGLDGKVTESGESLLLESVGQGLRSDGGLVALENLQSVLIAPLRSKDDVIGTMGMGTRSAHRFTAEEKTLLEAIGTQIGVAVDNIRLFRREQESRRQSTALSAVATIVNQSLELEQVLGNALAKVSEVIGVDVGWVYLVQEETQEVVFTAQRGMSDEAAAILDRVKVGEGLNGKVAQSGMPLAVEDFSQDPGRLTRMAKQEYLQALLIVPLKSKGKIVGTLGVGMRVPRRFSAVEIELVCAIGEQIGIAIEHARLYQREREIAQQLRDSEQEYRDLFDNASDAIFVHDLRGNIIAANQALARLTGYAQGELEGMNIGSLFVAESVDITREAEHRLLEHQASGGPYELTLVRRGGTQVVVEVAARLITRGGQPVGFQHIARDVTEERQRRDSLRFYIREVTRAQEEERKRVARELHDDTAQALVALSRDLDNLASSGDSLSRQAAERLERLRGATTDILEGVRRYSQDLRPSIVDDLGLLPGLEWLASELTRQHGILAEVSLLGDEQRLAPESELALFRIAQEALNNIRKHSQATRAEIVVQFAGDKLRMTVSDNGKGFKQPQNISELPSSGKLGLVGMQERTRLVGGSLSIHSELGQGTTVSVEIPIVLDNLPAQALEIPVIGVGEPYFDSRFF